MNNNELKKLEIDFDIALHDSIKRILLNSEKILNELSEIKKYSDDRHRAIYFELQTYYSANLEVRDNLFAFDEDDDSKDWPKEYFIFGGDCGGNFYCVNGAQNSDEVYFYNHEEFEIVKVQENAKDFILSIFKEYGELALYGVFPTAYEDI